MSKYDRFWISICMGCLVAFTAHSLGVQWWTSWAPGDASDFGLFSAIAVFLLLKVIR